MATKKKSWYTPLRAIRSKGSQTEVVGGLAGLHKAREQHLGQFFTPEAVVALMWRIAGQDGRNKKNENRVRLLDNSFGSGRMFQLADPDRHELYGIEIDAELAFQVRTAANAAGFQTRLHAGSMEDYRVRSSGFSSQVLDLALINPPFSITLDNPHVEPFACNGFGRYGAKSSALTHRYAVAQALKWCRNVVAVGPTSLIDDAKSCETFSKRLCAIYRLPPKTFAAEGTNVDVAVLVWGENETDEVQEKTLLSLDDEVITLDVRSDYYWRDVEIDRASCLAGEPAVRIPYTGDKTVRVAHNGRRIVLGFNCGAAQGRVMNAVYESRAYSHRSRDDGRLPACVKFKGQGKLDLENYLAADDPIPTFYQFVGRIRLLGYRVQVDPGVTNYLRKRARRLPIQRAAFRHVVNFTDGGLSRWLERRRKPLQAVAKRAFPVWGKHGGPDVEAGTNITLTRTENKRWVFVHGNRQSSVETDELADRFDFPEFKPDPETWSVVEEGLAERFPERFREMMGRARRMQLQKWCSWDYQLYDLCEIAMKRGHTVVAWEMGLGKARLSYALCALSRCKHNLVVVEAHLVKEMINEIKVLGIHPFQWQVIESPEQLNKLRKYNIISYSRLKSAVHRDHPKITYAKRLRHRIGVMVADEGHLLRNMNTDQSRAVAQVSPKMRYALSGTPVANYPRDILPLIQWVAGDGTAAQPFGRFHPYMEQRNVEDVGHSVRGVDKFKNMFVTLEWVTNEFCEDLREGAKREVPKIKDVAGFRALVAPRVKRRVMPEPEVAAHVNIPRAVRFTREIKWDRDHLIHYVAVARQFVDWFKNLDQYDKRRVGLIAILAKMHAVYVAANFPQTPVAGLPPHDALTSKQRYALKRLEELARKGHKTIFLAHSPAVVKFMAERLKKKKVRSVLFHGEITIQDRVRSLDDEFRYGDAQVLLATKGVLQTGYNIHQADRVVLYDRSWTPKEEHQAVARVLRPQQTKQVEVEYLHLEGSIDDYQAQMVEAKAESMHAGLDYGDEDPTREFLHIETILGRFAEEFEDKIGKSFHELIAEKGLRAC